MAVGFDYGRFPCGVVNGSRGVGLGTGHVESERTVQHERLVHVHRVAGMHLADEADLRAERGSERHAVGEYVFRVVSGFAAEVEVREVTFAGTAESRGIDHRDAGGQHDRDGHRNRVAVFVGGVDGVGIEDRVIVLFVAHVTFLDYLRLLGLLPFFRPIIRL